MPDFGADLRYARLYFRRKCTVAGVLSLPLLTQYADQVAACAQEEVLFIGNTFDGGSANSQAKFAKLAAATVLEELILEADPTQPREADQTLGVFRRRGGLLTELI